MSKDRQETIADIIEEKRSEAQYIRENNDTLIGREYALKLEEEADRIEAAYKREREAGAEAAQRCGEIGALIGREAACRKPVTDCHWLNAAAMREAIESISEYAKAAACHTEDAHLLGYLNQIERWAEAAVADPPRNCDRPECATTKEAQEVWRKEDGGKTAYYEWLLAISTKGEAK